MSPLSKEQIEFLLEQLGYETVAEWDKGASRVQRREMGYRDGIAGKCQAVLSMMLQVKLGSR